MWHEREGTFKSCGEDRLHRGKANGHTRVDHLGHVHFRTSLFDQGFAANFHKDEQLFSGCFQFVSFIEKLGGFLALLRGERFEELHQRCDLRADVANALFVCVNLRLGRRQKRSTGNALTGFDQRGCSTGMPQRRACQSAVGRQHTAEDRPLGNGQFSTAGDGALR